MEKGQKYKLLTFNGSAKPDEECEPSENYWILIGQLGTLVSFSPDLNFGDDNRVLIQFDQELEKHKLECHNSVPNALWILKADLEKKEN